MTRKLQRGTTIIGLMIGLLVSVISILASLSLYRSLVDVATEAKLDALHDGKLATSLLTIQLKVQNAGFGLDASNANIFILTDGTTKDLYWRYKVDGVTTCEGIRRYSRTHGGFTGYAIDFIAPDAGACDEATNLQAMTWNSQSTLSFFADDPQVVDFNLTELACSPFGMSTPEDHFLLTLTGKTSVNKAGVTANGELIDDNILKLCLPNIRTS